jgi:small subunit ribosomal protein S3e
VGGKLRSQRGKVMKFCDGYMIHSGYPCRIYKDCATKHVLLRSGTIGIKVVIVLPFDPEGKMGPKVPQPDFIRVHEPKEEPQEAPTPTSPAGLPTHAPTATPAAPVAPAPAVEVAPAPVAAVEAPAVVPPPQ